MIALLFAIMQSYAKIAHTKRDIIDQGACDASGD
jgi:hypothetical protein